MNLFFGVCPDVMQMASHWRHIDVTLTSHELCVPRHMALSSFIHKQPFAKVYSITGSESRAIFHANDTQKQA